MKVTQLLLKYLTKRARYQSSKNPAANKDNFEVKKPSAHGNCSQPTETLLIDQVDLSQDLGKATSQEEVEEVQKAEVSRPKEISDTLDLTRSFKSIRRDTSILSQDVKKNLDSFLQRDLKRRLDSVLVCTPFLANLVCFVFKFPQTKDSENLTIYQENSKP